MDEANVINLFKNKEISRMKKLFEGRGKATEVKYGDVENSWKDAYFYISSNELPK
jgi:hypothetical protein